MADNRGIGEFPGPGADGMIDELPCVTCAKPTLSVLETALDDVVVCWAYMCRPCQGEMRAELATKRERFDELLAGGMSRELANEVMIRWPGPAAGGDRG